MEEPLTLRVVKPDDARVIVSELNDLGYDFDETQQFPENSTIKIEAEKDDLEEVRWQMDEEYDETEQTLRLSYSLWETTTGGAMYWKEGGQYTLMELEQRGWNKKDMDYVETTFVCFECDTKTFCRYRITESETPANCNCDHCGEEILLG